MKADYALESGFDGEMSAVTTQEQVNTSRTWRPERAARACARSRICSCTFCSMAVGSAVASSPSTRMRLLMRTFGGGGSSSPCTGFGTGGQT